jgi:hypothetical protein
MTAEDHFWNWFVRHEPALFSFDPEQVAERERIFDEIAVEIQKIDPDLSFEFGPNRAKREFIISASGIKSAFPAVIRLAKAAPPLDRWEVIAFRPRRAPIHGVQIGNKRIDPDGVQFSLVDDGKIAGIYLFIRGFQDSDVDWHQIGYLLLDEALGEYDVECRLGLIKMLSPDQHKEWKRHPLVDLPAMFDGLVARLEGRSGEPS